MKLQKDAVPTRVAWWRCLKMLTQFSKINILMQFVVEILTLLCSDDSIKIKSPWSQNTPTTLFFQNGAEKSTKAYGFRHIGF